MSFATMRKPEMTQISSRSKCGDVCSENGYQNILTKSRFSKLFSHAGEIFCMLISKTSQIWF